MAYLVQVLIPTDGTEADARRHATVRVELLERFGGLTAYSRAPAKGLWKDESSNSEVVHDDIVVYEIITQRLDRRWWRQYRSALLRRFEQEVLLVAAHPVTVIR